MTKPRARLLLTSCSLALFAAVLALRGEPDDTSRRYIIINADDAGMCRSVNLATIRAMEDGLVSSASVMVPCPGFEEFAAYARTHPEKDLGVHLTLTCDAGEFRWGPLLPAERVPSLVDENGHFWSTSDEVTRHAERDEVEVELRAQIERAVEAGIRPTHLDNHMYSLENRRDLRDLYVQLGLEYSVPVRLPRRRRDSRPSEDGERTLTGYERQLAVLNRAGVPLVDAVETDNYSVTPQSKRAYFLNLLKELGPGVTEIVVHCAEDDRHLPQPPDISRREADTAIFTSLEMAEELDRLGIQVITWQEFVTMQQALHE